MSAPFLFADVILPVSIDRPLTYRVPMDLAGEVEVGKRVVVPLGRSKLYSGVIAKLHDKEPGFGQIKDIQSVLDERPILGSSQLTFWEWMANYYLCAPGDVMNAAIPSALRLQSETIMVPAENGSEILSEMEEGEERAILEMILDRGNATVQDIQRIFPGRSAQKRLQKLVLKGAVMVSEEIGEKYRPLQEVRIRLHADYSDEARLQALFDQLEKDARKQKQSDALMCFMQSLYDVGDAGSVRKKDLLSDERVSASSIQTLVKNHVLEEVTFNVDRLEVSEHAIQPLASLSSEQENALHAIRTSWSDLDTVLLHGVTSSGKTEVYLHLIKEAISRGEQVLYLVPEIALTAQMVRRLQKHLGSAVGVYHSRFSSNERVEIWNKVLDDSIGGTQVVLGARSALFLPFKRLGLIIVDEEHDASYKQQDPAPRYHARDAAILLAHQQNAKVLLGSATPSIESYFNAAQGRYGLVEMKERFGGIQLPEIQIADVREAARKRQMKSHFSPLLLESVKTALDAQEQVILCQKRRGFAPYLECS
ncbi:MAG: primosomal protein N', partial [Bacteroidota bacterium]